MNVYQITIGPRNAPRLSFPAMARDSATAVQQHLELAGADRLEVRSLAPRCPRCGAPDTDTCRAAESWEVATCKRPRPAAQLPPDAYSSARNSVMAAHWPELLDAERVARGVVGSKA